MLEKCREPLAFSFHTWYYLLISETGKSFYGEMSERFKEPVLKTGGVQ